MSVKPITNPQAQNPETINRGRQRSLKNTTVGNRAQSVNPGANFGKGFAITLRDIDGAIINHIKHVIKPTVKEANEIIKVPVLYANEERWKSVRKNGVLRDKNNSIIFPVIIIRRTDISFNDDLPLSFDHDLKGDFVKIARANLWSKKNRYDRFTVQQGRKPVQEFVMTGMPDFVVCTYSIITATAYIEQMNSLNELFIKHLKKYFGDSVGYKFMASLDGGISDGTEMTADNERIIKNEFSISVNGYLMPEFMSTIFGTKAEMSKAMSPSKVVFGFEGSVTTAQVKK